MEFKGQIYSSLNDWEVANKLANDTLKKLNNYTSIKYATNPIQTSDNKFILIELKGFEDELKEVGFEFTDLDKSIIKVTEI